MNGEYGVPCQRCGIRNAMQRRADVRVADVFAAATHREPRDVRLCSSCHRTVDNLAFAVAKAKRRT